MTITTSELRKNQKKYLEMSLTEDVYITKNGKIRYVISNPNKDKMKDLDSLRGILKGED